ncbi:MAG: hypothetical protein Q4F00_10820 [bacterium]|nr:hypothetical protein [bacterium]
MSSIKPNSAMMSCGPAQMAASWDALAGEAVSDGSWMMGGELAKNIRLRNEKNSLLIVSILFVQDYSFIFVLA